MTMAEDPMLGKFTITGLGEPIHGTVKLISIDEKFFQDLARDTRWERAIQLRAARKDPDRGRYLQFRKEYVTKERWLHSGRGVSK